MQRTLFALLFAATLVSCASTGGEEFQVTPQRPTVSSDTNTTAQGTLELEAGGAFDPGDSFDSPMLLKYGSGESTEVVLGVSPLRWVDRPGDDGLGFGDLQLGARHRFMEASDRGPAGAVLGLVKLPTAREEDGLGTGELDASLAGILTQDLDGYVGTFYYSLDFLGDPTGGTDLGHTLALAGSLPPLGKLGGFGELSMRYVRPLDDEVLSWLMGATYTVSPSLVFDAAVAFGLTSDAPDAVLIFGLTRNFGRVGRR